MSPPTSFDSTGEGSGEPIGVTFNAYDKASFITLSRDRRTMTSLKGYRAVKSTAGASSGAIFFEFTVMPDSKPTAHFRCVYCALCRNFESENCTFFSIFFVGLHFLHKNFKHSLSPISTLHILPRATYRTLTVLERLQNTLTLTDP